MPGLVVFRRRWSVGSDDLVVPGIFLLVVHIIWLLVISITLAILKYDTSIQCVDLMWLYKLGYLAILIVTIGVELAICVVSLRGSILETEPRSSMQYWLYIKLILLLIEVSWLVIGSIWLSEYYFTCAIENAKEIMLGLVITNWLVFLSVLVTIWCTYDAAGRSWVKMKKYQRSMRESESRFNYKRSGSVNRNWRQRKVIRAYQDSWDHRCRLLFCCMGSSERNRNSFADIARLLSDFFRELDVVPSDVVAGLVLLRKFQKLERETIVRQRKNGTYEFLSGVPITERTQFLALNNPREYDHFQTVIHYMNFAQGAYGWPMFLMAHSGTGICQLCPELGCCFNCCRRKDTANIIKDNCCDCNYAALKKMLAIGEVEVIYVTYHVDVGETPFFVAVDYSKSKIVVSIRGTLSMKDVLTDLNAEGEVLPLDPPRDDWLGHKGMIQAAVYIKQKLDEENLIQRALTHNPGRNTQSFDLVLVGHSLGAGTAAILAVLLKPQFPSLQCFSYSPPGGLLSMPAVEYTKTFITSVVVGKDVVPRIGLHQMEAMRADLINAIKQSVDPKWKTITCSVICCGCASEPTSVLKMSSTDANVNVYEEQRCTARKTSAHPNDSSIALTLHHPLYPPGRIIHVVRHHPSADEHKYERGWRQLLQTHEPVYQAIWADTTDFDEVLISPVMLQDHMPDTVLNALNKVLYFKDRPTNRVPPTTIQRESTASIDSIITTPVVVVNDTSWKGLKVITTYGPRKPQRQSSSAANSSVASDCGYDGITSPETSALPTDWLQCHTQATSPTMSHRLCLETSFTCQHNNHKQQQSQPDEEQQQSISGRPTTSKASSMAGSLFSRSQLDSILQYDDVSSLATDDGGVTIKSDATTVPMMSDHHPVNSHSRAGRTVAFEDTAKRKPNTLPVSVVEDERVAPLASPESLSEISSICSRVSIAASMDRYCQQRFNGLNNQEQSSTGGGEVFESQLHTPKVMRRTPKIAGNLSSCADDWRSVDKYKRMGHVFTVLPTLSPPNFSSDESTEHSFESAESFTIQKCCNAITDQSSRSADNLDESGQIDLSVLNMLTKSDSAIVDDLQIENALPLDGIMTSSSLTYHSARSSFDQLMTNCAQRYRFGVLESHFPVLTEPTDKCSLLPAIPAVPTVHVAVATTASPIQLSSIQRQQHTPKTESRRGGFMTSMMMRKRNGVEDKKLFPRNESLPLLANLNQPHDNSRSSSSSPTFVKRKTYVYPMSVQPTTSTPLCKSESNV